MKKWVKVKKKKIQKNNVEYHPNIEFCKDKKMSPEGIDYTVSVDMKGKRILEKCSIIDDNNYLIEIYEEK